MTDRFESSLRKIHRSTPPAHGADTKLADGLAVALPDGRAGGSHARRTMRHHLRAQLAPEVLRPAGQAGPNEHTRLPAEHRPCPPDVRLPHLRIALRQRLVYDRRLRARQLHDELGELLHGVFV